MSNQHVTRLRTVNFTEVRQVRRRPPSWMSGSSPAPKQAEEPPPPPELPSQFVAAMRQEVGSLRPPEAELAEKQPPRTSLQSLPVAAPAPAPAPTIKEVVDEEATRAFRDAALMLARARGEVIERTAEQLAQLAQAIARRVVAHELSVNPQLVRGLVAEGLAALGAHDKSVVRLGARFAGQADTLQDALAHTGERCDVVVDPSLEPFGCVVETELGRVDESLDVRLATLLQALKPDSEVP